MMWFYYLNGGNQGPVETAELQRLLQREVISLDTPVWSDGIADWVRLRDSTAAPAVATSQVCAECGKLFPEEEMLSYENSWVCAVCKPVFFQKIKEGVKPLGALVYSSVGRRFAAVFLDGIGMFVFIFVIMVLVAMTIAATNAPKAPMPGYYMVIVILLAYVFPPLYEILFIGKYGATPGKMLLRIKVVNPAGGPISYARSTGRYFAKILSGITLCIGYLMAFWDPEKRALHDQLCETRVITSDRS